MEFLILIICGCAIGLFSSFFGIGGGALIVPVLYSLYPGIEDTVVISTSLGSIFFMTMINSFNFYKAKLAPAKRVVIIFGINALLGGFLGSQLTYMVNTEVSKKIIAITLILIVFKNLFFKTKKSDGAMKDSELNLAMTGFFGAFVSSVTGLGGGVIFVPMLISLVRLPVKLVPAYSNVIMVFATFIGTVPHFFHQTQIDPNLMGKLNEFFIGQVNLAIVIILVFCGYFTSKLGVKLNHTVSDKNKKYALSFILVLLSFKMFLS